MRWDVRVLVSHSQQFQLYRKSKTDRGFRMLFSRIGACLLLTFREIVAGNFYSSRVWGQKFFLEAYWDIFFQPCLWKTIPGLKRQVLFLIYLMIFIELPVHGRYYLSSWRYSSDKINISTIFLSHSFFFYWGKIHITKINHLKVKKFRHLADSQCWATTTSVQLENIFTTQKEKLIL